MIQRILKELLSFEKRERWFILSAMFCGFFINAEYAIARPVSNSVFIAAYSTQWFPYAWLAVVPFNLCLIALYNKYLPRFGSLKMQWGLISVIIAMSVGAALFLQTARWLPFVFYVWKEIYVMLMFQQLWSVVHSTIPFHRAKYLYGILFGIGALGATMGSLLPSFFAVQMGSEQLLLATPIIYGLMAIAYRVLIRCSAQGQVMHPAEEKEKQSAWQAFKFGVDLIANSRFLLFILLIVVFMQVSTALIDFQFNHFLEKVVPNKDLRTAYTARVMGITHIGTMMLQFLGSFLLVHFLGFKKSHLLIPAILICNAVGFLFFPTMSIISLSFITIKCFDFSLFGVIKEMLYIPLKKEEKFRAKSVIDVFAHRSSKALASLLILCVQWIAIPTSQFLFNWLGIAIFVLWGVTVWLMFKTYEPVRNV